MTQFQGFVLCLCAIACEISLVAIIIILDRIETAIRKGKLNDNKR